MELNNEFRVGVPIDQAWSTLTDIEYIAPCMPGAQLTEIDGDNFKGQVKVKVGPITAQYKGAAKFIEKNEAEHKVVIDASGRDTRGAGNAAAEITAVMVEDGDGTKITIATDLKVTGKVAQFGRGVMADVSEKLIGQFVECLEGKLAEAPAAGEAPQDGSPEDAAPADAASADAAPAAEPTSSTTEVPAASSGPRKINMPEPAPVDLLDTAGAPVLKRLAPVALLLVLFLLLRRRRRS
ncbi:MAG: carbon monoxide dehydrogenase subunit G [Candidatus Poriferisodalaceae bacterium]|jgi:carbon monoxide dehydrogenase subunit G